jgi:hypothetical protein
MRGDAFLPARAGGCGPRLLQGPPRPRPDRAPPGDVAVQRITAIAVGYEDLEDDDQLRHDPMTPSSSSYHCTGKDHPRTRRRRQSAARRSGRQVLRHGCYDGDRYLPLYIFCGRHLLVAKLRPANMDGCAGALEEVIRVVARIRSRWPTTRILLRPDSGFCRDILMAWAEANSVVYLFSLARNRRLEAAIGAELQQARVEPEASGKPARRFKELSWRTRKSWSCQRRVMAKAEWTKGKASPRFVVTSLPVEDVAARRLDENVYCARGEVENRTKECQLDLFADCTTAATMAASQLRLWFASFAYVLLSALRRIGLAGTQLANATCGPIRLRLLKIGALVRISVRRVVFAMASGCPWQAAFAQAHAPLRQKPGLRRHELDRMDRIAPRQVCPAGGGGAALPKTACSGPASGSGRDRCLNSRYVIGIPTPPANR